MLRRLFVSFFYLLRRFSVRLGLGLDRGLRRGFGFCLRLGRYRRRFSFGLLHRLAFSARSLLFLCSRSLRFDLLWLAGTRLLDELERVADLEQSVSGAWYGAGNEKHASGGIALQHLQIANGDLLCSHVTGHAHPLEDAARPSGADGAARSMPIRLAVGLWAAGKAVALHHAGEAAALAHTSDVDAIALLEHLDADPVAHLVG